MVDGRYIKGKHPPIITLEDWLEGLRILCEKSPRARKKNEAHFLRLIEDLTD